MTTKNGNRYDDTFKAHAVANLRLAGYPDDEFALGRVSKSLGLPSRTLRRWATGEQGAPPQAAVNTAQRDLADQLERLTFKLLAHVNQPHIIEKMNGAQSVTAAAILIDKMRLLQGLPTTILGILPDFLATLEENKIDATEFFQRATARLNGRND